MVLVSRLDNVKCFRQSQSPDAQAQLVAQALVAFSSNNEQRVEAGRVPLDTQTILGIMIVGTTPIFYRIPVTRDLIEHIAQGTYPPNATYVTCCQPPVPRPDCLYSEGMKPLDSRYQIRSCYEASKPIIGI
ncbi:hypothetical protein L210DRAFT_3572291 [Boletus edulis BED1]|uniref:Uncharacterized protein n=1 Tax=Boletus edulis BED1 TaxID=1328754 RepID=A0AAD4BDN3_BOLED|nr:hypothetical protein L210DRAFT_3572291 [Boletus edulis BED1]